MLINALIPARSGSKGIKNKNILDIGGFPLIAYSIVACDKCNRISNIFVSTDSSEIAQVAKKYSSKVVIPSLRPESLATDKSTDYDVLKHYFKCFFDSEEVAYIRPTTPNRNIVKLGLSIDQYQSFYRQVCTGVRSVHEIETVYKMFKISGNGYCNGFFEDFRGEKNYTNLPRQSFEKSYCPNGYIDIVKQKTIDAGSDFGEQIKPIITPKVLELDTPDDLKLVELDLINSELYVIMKSL